MTARTRRPARPVPTDELGQLLFDVFAQDCPSRHALENVTGRWGLLALVALRDGTARFNALRRRVDGVSEKMLAQTLRTLERDGFIHRAAQPTIPPRVDYTLTPLGRETADQLFALIQQIEGRMPAVRLAQSQYDER
ncbi:MAG TPA: helix-turn-helix domain-containing protein [Micromonosporaceae bacterium]|nr:helix-turn-helix domain-containing protein [Micromonosporaceae bacterium]